MVQSKTIISTSAKQTKKFAAEFIKSIPNSAVVALFGDLGSGKTTFVQGVARALGIKNKVQSPTFVLLKPYNTKHVTCNINSKVKTQKSKPHAKIKNLIHADLYRIKSACEIEEIGLMEYFNEPNTIIFIEWPEVIEKILPKNTIKIQFEHLNEDKRKITIYK